MKVSSLASAPLFFVKKIGFNLGEVNITNTVKWVHPASDKKTFPVDTLICLIDSVTYKISCAKTYLDQVDLRGLVL